MGALTAKRLGLLATALSALLVLAAPVQAKQVQPYHYSGKFFSAGGSTPAAIAFSEADQAVLVVGTGDKANGLKVSKFTPAGASSPFADLPDSPSSFTTGLLGGERPAIAVDDSATASAGNFYLATGSESGIAFGKVDGYAPGGTRLPGFPLLLSGACGVAVAPDGNLWVASRFLGRYSEYTPAGIATGRSLFFGARRGGCQIAIDAAGNFYLTTGERLSKYDPEGEFLLDLGPASSEGASLPVLAFDREANALLELFGGDESPVVQADPEGNPLSAFGGPDPAHFFYPGLVGARGLAVDSQTHDVYMLKASTIDVFAREASAVTVPDVTTSAPGSVSATGATLRGTLDPDGVTTTDCRFEWGTDLFYGKTAPCTEGDVFAGGSGESQVSATITGLEKGTVYHYRLVAENANGVDSYGRDEEFRAANAPLLSETAARSITTDAAKIHFDLTTEGGDSTYRVEVGTDTSYGMSFPVPEAKVPTTRPGPQFEGIEVILTPQAQVQEIVGLAPNTLYHYRVIATNPAGEDESQDRTFRTFALPGSGADPCPNAHARQQTGAAGLMDCRAYELVSAPDTGGYDVRSGLSSGVAPLPTSPAADDAALYSMQSGTIPGVAGNPTNRGADPYVAVRGANGWSTRYVGLPANNPNASGPFSSPLLAFDGPLSTFAFGGPGICNPCFEDGSTNVPLRLPSGELIQGMKGAFEPESPSPAGVVRKNLSSDGTHFIFGSTAQLEPGANESGTDATIYDRNLTTGTTQVVSTDETGATIANGQGVAALDVSEDGSRIVIGRLISTDASGNPYYHLYMHQGTSPNAIDLTPGTTTGAIYAGMSEDGSSVYFTTPDTFFGITPLELDTSADLYRADVEGQNASLELVSVGEGGAGTGDECDTPANSFGSHWNVVGTAKDCSVAAIAGGGGVASSSGAIYFLSPEQLEEGEGTEDAPNLYRAAPGGAPEFVTTLESQLTGADPLPTQHPFVKTFAVPNAPQSIAVDQSADYVYVISTSAGIVRRFDPEGNPANFTAGPNTGTNTLTGFTFLSGGTNQAAQVAINNSGGATDGTVYVTNNSGTDPTVKVFSRTGAPLGQLAGTQTPETRFGTASGTLQYPTGVAVAPNGTLYVAGGNSGKVYRYAPSASPVAEADYEATLNFGSATSVAGVLAADAGGHLYAHKLGSSGALSPGLLRFDPSQFGAGGAQTPTTIDANSTAAYPDPLSNRLYVDRINAFAEYSSAGELLGTFGQGKVSESRGIAVLGSPDGATSRVYASVGGNKVAVFDTLPAASLLVDNPLVTHAVHDTEVLNPGDFQTSASGNYAAFASTIALTEQDDSRKAQLFLYGSSAGSLACASCSPTEATPTEDATLTPYGRALTDDGRLFFTSQEQLVLRDSNEKADAYELSDGTVQLISTGTSESDSELLSVSSDGVNAFFFTRQKLVKEDQNGSNTRLYTAREGGGYATPPPTFQCAAADECHGPGTKAPEPLQAGTTAATPGQFAEEAKPTKCGKGKVRRRGRCVNRKKPKPKAKKHSKQATGKRGSK